MGLRENEYDLLISDIEMPGNQDLVLIRDVPQLVEGLPIILVTGHPTIETATQCFQLSVVAYLIKPFESHALLEAVAQAVERYQAYRVVCGHRRRLQASCEDLERVESLMRARAGTADGMPWSAFPSMTLHEIVESLHELENYVAITTPHSLPNPAALVLAIRETIAVLEKTKGSFKSKELADLRRRLESVVKQNRGVQ